MEKRRQQEYLPSFFKVLIGDFDKQLRIPQSFVAGNVTKLPKSAVIEAVSGNSRARHPVTIEQVGENHCFTNGWSKLVKSFKLNPGDFATFLLVSDTVFKASFYGPNGCEKQICSPRDDDTSAFQGVKSNLRSKKENKKAKPEAGSKKGYACGKSFKVLMKKHRRYILRLPVDFLIKTGIAGKKWVVLKNRKGEVWPVHLIVRRNGYTDLTTGWADFRRANKIVEGRFCVFKFIEDNVILVRKLQKRGRSN